MPLSAAEKMRCRREKFKEEGIYEEYKLKVKEAVQKSRKKQKQKIKELTLLEQTKLQKETRKLCRLRVARYRQKVAETSISLPTTPDLPKAFKTKNTMGKATAKAYRALPHSPRKRKTVVKKLYEKFVGLTSDCVETKQKCNPKTALSSETVAKVKEFYERDDLSRQAPGIKDVVTIRDAEGNKTKIQARHLLLSIREVHGIFSNENADCKIGKSKFFELRPKHVLLSSKLPRNVCLCKFHENFKLAVEVFQTVYQFPSFSNVVDSFLCADPSEKCWLSDCEVCCGQLNEALENIIKDENVNNVSWYVWKKQNEHLQKILEEGTSRDLAEHIKNLAPAYFEHVYIKREQSAIYRQQVKSAVSPSFNPKIGIIQIDFAENYTCSFQDEIQSAHWQQNQISLFTASLWYSGSQHSTVLASDNLAHSKETVIAFIDYLLEQLPEEVNDVHMWSDGPSSQFKNRYIAAAINILQNHHSKFISWNFFATSHGKGPVDGIGGAVKRSVRVAVLKRKQIVTNAEQFVLAAQDQPSRITIQEIRDHQIDERNTKLKLANLFSQAPPLQNIKRFHHLKFCDGKAIGFCLTKNASQEQNIESQIKVNDWYMVNYDDSLYPGIVTFIEDNDFKVSVMVSAGSNWKWPNHPDEIFYKKKDLIHKIKPPVVVNARGHYKLEE